MRQWRLPRGWRIVRNLTLALLLLLFMWGEDGYPIPDPRLNFRRTERANLTGPADIQGVFRDGREDWWVAGTEQDQVVLLKCRSLEGLRFWPRGRGGVLLPVPGDLGMFEREQDILAVDVPAGTASARLELRVGCWYLGELWQYTQISSRREDFDLEKGEPRRWDKVYTVEGELLRDGGVLFRVVSDDEGMDLTRNVAGLERLVLVEVGQWNTYESTRNIECEMEAVFYDGNGGELGRAALAAPGGGKMDAS